MNSRIHFRIDSKIKEQAIACAELEGLLLSSWIKSLIAKELMAKDINKFKSKK